MTSQPAFTPASRPQCIRVGRIGSHFTPASASHARYSASDPHELKPMLQQFPGDKMQTWPVGKAVGNVRNQGPLLIEPIDAAEDLSFG